MSTNVQEKNEWTPQRRTKLQGESLSEPEAKECVVEREEEQCQHRTRAMPDSFAWAAKSRCEDQEASRPKLAMISFVI